jgi:hypothetical protein
VAHTTRVTAAIVYPAAPSSEEHPQKSGVVQRRHKPNGYSSVFTIRAPLLLRRSVLPFDDGQEAPNDFQDPSEGTFKGTLELNIYSWDSKRSVFMMFSTYPLGYDTIQIEVRAVDGEILATGVTNLLIFTRSDALEVLDIKHRRLVL